MQKNNVLNEEEDIIPKFIKLDNEITSKEIEEVSNYLITQGITISKETSKEAELDEVQLEMLKQVKLGNS